MRLPFTATSQGRQESSITRQGAASTGFGDSARRKKADCHLAEGD